MSALGYENVGRLDVTVNNASRVSRLERVGDLNSKRL
jgi:hypothetical protein